MFFWLPLLIVNFILDFSTSLGHTHSNKDL
jgi:hypothetical protein